MKGKIYSKEEKEIIVKEALESKSVKNIASKYNISRSAIYDWINVFKGKQTRTVNIKVRLSNKELKNLEKKIANYGYQKDVSSFIRKILFDKKIAITDPSILAQEFYKVRAELNKIGSNINQIAHYSNFLALNKYVEDKHLTGALDQLKYMDKAVNELTSLLDASIKNL